MVIGNEVSGIPAGSDVGRAAAWHECIISETYFEGPWVVLIFKSREVFGEKGQTGRQLEKVIIFF